MKLDVLIIRIGICFTAGVDGLFAQSVWRKPRICRKHSTEEARQIISAILGAIIAGLIIGFEMRARAPA